ncbi:MAG: DUF1028 domain-containing protein [Anaerolineae bacterium]|nr:DUF1028 domain-containing protein [Anaerolineae bacterium]
MTYSIAARDPNTGEMGVAVQSHWFSVGTAVSWAEAGVGAVATQSLVEVSFGPRGLALLRQGLSAREAVEKLVDSDEGQDVRQLAIVDAKGRAAAHTGDRCIPEAGHKVGEGFSVQANMMLNDTVWGAMFEAFQSSADQPLAERLIIALEAAQAEGGDIRGKQSAAVLVVRGESTGKVWEDRLIDLRVEDHPEPVKEIRRLLTVHRAYEEMNKGDEALERDDVVNALKHYSAAEAMIPDNLEMRFWHAVSLVNIGRIDEAYPIFHAVFKEDDNWYELAKRLPDRGFLTFSHPDDYVKIFGFGP